jgi:hypothetical protein
LILSQFDPPYLRELELLLLQEVELVKKIIKLIPRSKSSDGTSWALTGHVICPPIDASDLLDGLNIPNWPATSNLEVQFIGPIKTWDLTKSFLKELRTGPLHVSFVNPFLLIHMLMNAFLDST